MDRLIQKLFNMAAKAPKGIYKYTFFNKYATLMGIEIEEKTDIITYSLNGRAVDVQLITSENCKEFKCYINPGIKGIRIWEFLKALTVLNTPYIISPPQPEITAGQEAIYYIEEAKKYLSL